VNRSPVTARVATSAARAGTPGLAPTTLGRGQANLPPSQNRKQAAWNSSASLGSRKNSRTTIALKASLNSLVAALQGSMHDPPVTLAAALAGVVAVPPLRRRVLTAVAAAAQDGTPDDHGCLHRQPGLDPDGGAAPGGLGHYPTGLNS
jgi:hypothetical protein